MEVTRSLARRDSASVFDALADLDRTLDRIFDEVAGRSTSLPHIGETDSAWLVTVDASGFGRDDLDVSVARREITVRGRHRPRRGWRFWRRPVGPERRCDHRIVVPSADPDGEVTADLSDGRLVIAVPKPAADRRRRIRVT